TAPTTANRQSTRVCTPLERPGFVATHNGSRRTLNAPIISPTLHNKSWKSATTNSSTSETSSTLQHPAHSKKHCLEPDSQDNSDLEEGTLTRKRKKQNPDAVDLAQDSDKENSKAKAKLKKCKGGFDNPKAYFFPGEPAPDQSNGGLTYKCLWCPKSVRVNSSTNSNLKTHCDGSSTQNQVRKPCPGRGKAISKGANLPQSSTEEAEEQKKKNATNTGTLTSFVHKGCFNNKTLNKLLVFWVIQHLLPWSLFDDFFLGVAFDYCNINSVIFSQTWAADYARKLYVNLQQQVIAAINVSNWFCFILI
ncbi:hypothetical protein PCASD_25865, partial [Puccinia coronata f. sp. avenae]